MNPTNYTICDQNTKATEAELPKATSKVKCNAQNDVAAANKANPKSIRIPVHCN